MSLLKPRPSHVRRTSSNGLRWYNEPNTTTLEEYAARARTMMKRFEKYQGDCAKNIVMGLMSPAAVALFLFSPLWILLWIAVASYWALGWR